MTFITTNIDIQFWELLAENFSETVHDEYIDFDVETITLEPAADPTQEDWQKECLEKSIIELFQSENTVLNYDSNNEIPDDEKDVRKWKNLRSLQSECSEVLTEIHGEKQMKIMLNEFTKSYKSPSSYKTLYQVLSFFFFFKK